MTAQPDHRPEGPLAEATVGAIRAILALYDRRHLTLQTAIDEITALVDADRADAGAGTARLRPPAPHPDTARPLPPAPDAGNPPGLRRRLRPTE